MQTLVLCFGFASLLSANFLKMAFLKVVKEVGFQKTILENKESKDMFLKKAQNTVVSFEIWFFCAHQDTTSKKGY